MPEKDQRDISQGKVISNFKKLAEALIKHDPNLTVLPDEKGICSGLSRAMLLAVKEKQEKAFFRSLAAINQLTEEDIERISKDLAEKKDLRSVVVHQEQHLNLGAMIRNIVNSTDNSSNLLDEIQGLQPPKNKQKKTKGKTNPFSKEPLYTVTETSLMDVRNLMAPICELQELQGIGELKLIGAHLRNRTLIVCNAEPGNIKTFLEKINFSNSESFFIKTKNHGISIYKKNNTYHCYDPNSHEVVIVSSLDEVANYLLDINKYNEIGSDKLDDDAKMVSLEISTIIYDNEESRKLVDLAYQCREKPAVKPWSEKFLKGVISEAEFVDQYLSIQGEADEDAENIKWLKSFRDANPSIGSLLKDDIYEKNNIVLNNKLLIFASGKNYPDVVKNLSNQNVNINIADSYGMTPLHYAAYFGHDDVIVALLQNRADLTKKNPHNKTELFYALNEGHIDSAIVLIKAGADATETNYKGDTALDIAVREKRKDHIIYLLTERKIDPNKANYSGKTPLLSALGPRADIDIVRCLLEYGANPNLEAGSVSPLEQILMWILISKQKKDELFDIATLLLEKGVNINGTTSISGRTHLQNAVERKDIQVVNFLLSHGADPNVGDRWGDTPLIKAISNNDIIVAKLLLDQGANPQKANASGENVLHKAVQVGASIEMINLLMEKGCSPYAKNNEGESPFDYAVSTANYEYLRLFLSTNPKAGEEQEGMIKAVFDEHVDMDAGEQQDRLLPVLNFLCSKHQPDPESLKKLSPHLKKMLELDCFELATQVMDVMDPSQKIDDGLKPEIKKLRDFYVEKLSTLKADGKPVGDRCTNLLEKKTMLGSFLLTNVSKVSIGFFQPKANDVESFKQRLNNIMDKKGAAPSQKM